MTTLFGVAALVTGWGKPDVLPSGTVLEVRQTRAAGTRISAKGDPAAAVLIAPVVRGGRIVLPAGSELGGHVSQAQRLGLGFRHLTARLGFEFDSLRLPDGRRLTLRARLSAVDTGKESVDGAGRACGITPALSASASVAALALRVAVIQPLVGLPLLAAKMVLARAPDPEISFPSGTELRLRLAEPLAVGQLHFGPADAAPSGAEQAVVDEMVQSLPAREARDSAGRRSDPLNLLLIGEEEHLRQAFAGAGWQPADRRGPRAIASTYLAMVQRKGYPRAPVSSLTLAGEPPAMIFQKGLNSFARRHHVRIWRTAATDFGSPVWLAAATEDIGFRISWRNLRLTHRIDREIDRERNKLRNDLAFTGCVSSAWLQAAPPTSAPVQTDGRLAAIRLNDCAQPRRIIGADAAEPVRGRTLARIWNSFRTDLLRSTVWLAPPSAARFARGR